MSFDGDNLHVSFQHHQQQCRERSKDFSSTTQRLPNMATKEATVYIVDCGSTMGERSQGRKQTNLDFALEITATIATGRKTAMAGVVGLRTDGTRNDLNGEDDYAHITVFQDISQMLMSQVRKLRNELVLSSTPGGDAISAIIVAIQMIAKECKKLKYERKIVLVTDARGPMQFDDLGDIITKLKEDNVQLVVIGVDFDDAEYGFKEESKDATKAENEAGLKQLCNDCDGAFGTLAQAVDELGIPRVKSTKPVTSYKGFLTLGNPEQYETAMAIDIERYPKIMAATTPSASKFVVRSDMGDATQSTMTMSGEDGQNGSNDGLAAVKNAMTYQVVDTNAPGGKRDVDRDELSKGYEYGRTAVHISESDRNVTTYETTPGLDVIGFVDKNQYERYLDMSRAFLIIAQRNNEKASMALSSFIHALYELDSYAVARLVPKENKEPRTILLAPSIEPDFECLYDIELPFAEDMRSYKFPPLDRVVTVSGKEIKVHRNLPNDDLQDAMSDYVDSMDLSTFGKDDEGAPTEYMPMDETYAPMLHRIHQVIKHRAVFPDTEPPPPYEILTRYSHPPDELVQKAQPALDRVLEAANIKKVPPKARGRRGRKEAPKPLSELDIGALLAQDPKRKHKRIDPKNAIPEFRQLIIQAEEDSAVRDACTQLKNIVFDWIRHSVGNSGYGRALEAIRVMREEMVDMETPAIYNEIMQELRTKLLAGDLGEGRGEMRYHVVTKKLGLIKASDLPGGASDDEVSKWRAAG
ncbi:ATP-dependent DNA helicase yku80 [Friedmanniomyces endolithicus]|uniref:ATP-dependent DNA helicase II subunit 2 n=1 Tax=Rachicladosporium monterosium TaxID=1507873 RepID=A0ABR0LFN7_9PEZI|nr:ATP-dependent DNA helicase yku80 [Friedmanniomyces endolithicus]KAK5148060.1 ATP-dependent DNA helicase yku80 [Rachicladosporium monterosium]